MTTHLVQQGCRDGVVIRRRTQHVQNRVQYRGKQGAMTGDNVARYNVGFAFATKGLLHAWFQVKQSVGPSLRLVQKEETKRHVRVQILVMHSPP